MSHEHLTFLRCIVLLYFAIRLESRKSANKRIYLSIYLTQGWRYRAARDYEIQIRIE